MTAHTTFPRQTKIFIILKDGNKYIDYYIEKKNKFVFFRNLGKVNICDIKSISYFKNQTTNHEENIN